MGKQRNNRKNEEVKAEETTPVTEDTQNEETTEEGAQNESTEQVSTEGSVETNENRETVGEDAGMVLEEKENGEQGDEEVEDKGDEESKETVQEPTTSEYPFKSIFADYVKFMKQPMKSDKDAVQQQYNMYHILKHVVNTENPVEFNANMDALLEALNEFKEEGLDAAMLARYDYLWELGNKDLNTYLNISYVLTEIADPGKRDEALKAISLDKAFSTELTTLSPTAIENFKNYLAS